MPTLADNSVTTEMFYELIQSRDPGLEKVAIDAVNDYTRLMVRDGGAARKVLPPLPLENSDLDRQYDTSLPAKVVDMEVNSPAAVTAPLATMPTQFYIRVQRYRVLMARILSPWFQADVDELATNVIDIRQVMSDNAIKDMLLEEDVALINMTNQILVGPGQTCPFSGVVQWRQTPSSISRNSLIDAEKTMLETDSRLTPALMLLNAITIKEVQKFGFDEMGGDLSQDLFVNGWSEREFRGMKMVITINRQLVPDNSIFYYADPKWLGKFYTRQDTTMFVERRAYLLNYFAYNCLGFTIANPNGVARHDFAA